jgi:hypothetical protein
MTRAFQAAYVDLDTLGAQQELVSPDRAIGTTLTLREVSTIEQLPTWEIRFDSNLKTV